MKYNIGNLDYINKRSVVALLSIKNNEILQKIEDNNGIIKINFNNYNEMKNNNKYNIDFVICDIYNCFNIDNSMLEKCIIFINANTFFEEIEIDNYIKYNYILSQCLNIINEDIGFKKNIRNIFPINTEKIITLKELNELINKKSDDLKEFVTYMERDLKYLINEDKRLEELFQINNSSNNRNLLLKNNNELVLETYIEKIIEIYKKVPSLIESRR